jgi:phosphoribosylformylglycinamidine cyclo-ligase
MSSEGLTYAAAGVDVDAGERAVELMRTAVARAQRQESQGAFGGFAGLFDAAALTKYTRPLLATSTDGVGTKLVIAKMMDKHDTVGIDLVAMVVDDIVVCGAEPLFLTDYIACGKVVPERIAAIVTGIAQGCERAGVALLGGETAEHPGVMLDDDYDLAAAGTGVVEADSLLSADRVRAGDVIVAMQSSGVHSNGFAFVRRALFDRAHMTVHTHVDELGQTLGEALLEPTAIYTKQCLSIARSLGEELRVFSHITGGGIAANIARVLPEHLHSDIDRGTWRPQPIFDLIQHCAGAALTEMERTFNMGMGMVAVISQDAAQHTLKALKDEGVSAWVCGVVRERRDGEAGDAPAKGGAGGSVSLSGTYAK